MDYMKELLSKIINDGYKIKINHREINEKIVLFMNYRQIVDGKVKQETKRLGTLSGKCKKEDAKTVKDAMLCRHKFENTLKTTNEIFKNRSKNTNFFDFFNESIRLMKPATMNNFVNVRKKILKFSNPNLMLSQVDKKFCSRFIEYLNSLNIKTGNHYFARFKQILYRAIDHELIQDMPYLRKMNIKYHKPKREFLTQEELSKIYHTKTKFIEIKNAFVFGCFTGLRYIDLYNLKFTDINNDRIMITQQKTTEVMSIMLNDTALDIVKFQKNKNKNKEKVFNISNYVQWSLKLKEIIAVAGIDKKITGHCARHTFATLCITQGVDIYTTSKLLGHSDVRTTQVYAKLIDKKKDEAIKKLPTL